MGKEDFLKRNKEKVQIPLNGGSSPGRFQRFIMFIKSVKTLYVLIFFVSILILTLLAASFAFSEERYGVVPTCGDGTFYGKCSLDKSYYCLDGVLVERASVCGCPEGWKKSEESCVSEYHTGVRDLVLDYFFEGVIHNISFSVYEGGSDYVKGISRVISYEGSEIKSRSDFNVRSFDDEIQEFLIRPLVKEIQNLAPNNKVNQARIAVSIVQNIPYFPSNETFSFAGLEVDYSRYPYEVLYDYAGICGEKSELLAFLLRDLGYDVAIFYFADENHEAVGIKCPVEESLYGSGYCFVETGGHAIISDISMEFSEGVRLESTPDVLVVSRGISLPEGLDEYRDADTLRNIQERNFFGYLKFWKKDNIIKKYDLANTYGIL